VVNIRPATAADQRTLRRLVTAERLDPTAIRWQNFLVAEADGEVVGIGQIRRHPDCEELGSLIVQPPYRGRGVGGALVAALEARAGRPLYLFCEASRESYYARFGYRRIAPGDAPRSLRLKYLVPRVLRLFGLRILIMRKD
jgi:amino-acid N-acetyltransferase